MPTLFVGASAGPRATMVITEFELQQRHGGPDSGLERFGMDNPHCQDAPLKAQLWRKPRRRGEEDQLNVNGGRSREKG